MPRPSHVRDAIRELISTSNRHDWSPDDVLAALEERSVAADFSSVCRGLTYLERDGTIRRVPLRDEKTRYEVHGDHHEHVQCQSCGAVAEVPGCAVQIGHQPIESATGFVITGHSLLF